MTKAHPAPAILTTNGFGGTKADQADLAQSLGEHGYVTLSYTGLGFVDGDTCPITLDDREHDGEAASQLISFLGGDPSIQAVDDATGQAVHVTQVARQDATTHVRHDPVVGMIGGSYGGEIQFATAAVEHEKGLNRLDAIVPEITWNDLSYSLDPNNQLPHRTAASGSLSSDDPGAFKYQWSLLFSGEGVADGAQDFTALRNELTPAGFAQFVDHDCPNFSTQVCTALTEVATQGYPSQASIDFLRHASVASYVGDVRVPTFLAQGEADSLFDLQESTATWAALRAQGTPVALQWQSWGHSDLTPVPGELDQRHLASSFEGRQVLAWFGYWLKHQGSKPALGFSYFRDWVYQADTARGVAPLAAVTDAYTTAPSPVDATTTTYYLSGTSAGTVDTSTAGDGQLVAKRAQVQPGTSAYSGTGSPFGPNYTETSFIESMFQANGLPEPPVTDPAGTYVRFDTAPFATAKQVVGSPSLTVTLSAPTVTATQSAGPAGQLVLYAKLYDLQPNGSAVQIGLPHRLISPVRVSDVGKPVTVELPGIVHRFAAGDRLAVVLAGGDDAYRGQDTPQPVTLTTGPGIVQQLTVPFAGGGGNGGSGY